MDNGHTALINAVESSNINILRYILSIPGININHKRSNGDTALLIAAKKGDIAVINCLIMTPGIELSVRNSQRKTAYKIAVENGHKKIATLLKQEMDIFFLEQGIDPTVLQLSFAEYAKNLRKVPTRELYFEFLQLSKKTTETNSINKITEFESQYVQARRIWTEVVSATYADNKKYVEMNGVKDKVIQRLKSLNYSSPEIIYEHCLDLLMNYSVIVTSFKSEFLKKDLQDFQLLNVWEKNNWSSSSYSDSRDKAEEELFKFLPKELHNTILTNKLARPRYGALFLFDNDTYIKNIENYGESFLVFKDICKLNLLISPVDSLTYHCNPNKSSPIQLCTVHYLELLLLQFSDDKLRNIANWTTTGKLPSNFNQYQGSSLSHGYIEVLLPAINVFDLNMVESIYIDSNKFKIYEADLQILQNRGINIFNSPYNPYKELNEQFIQAIKDDNAKDVCSLLKKYPSLAKIIADGNMKSIHIAAKNGSVAVLKLFAQLNFDFTVDDYSSMRLAVKNNQFDALQFIVETICLNNTILGRHGNSALHVACELGHADSIQFIIKNNIHLNLINLYNQEGYTALHVAIRNNSSAAVIFLLLQNGANPNSKAILGDGTALHSAARFTTDPDTFQLLIQAKADIHAQIFFKEFEGWTPLHVAVHFNNSIAVKALLLHGVDINLKTKDGKTALALVNNKTNPEIIKIWINYFIEKCDVENLKLLKTIYIINFNEKDENGDTFLHKAIHAKFPDIHLINFILENKATANELNNNGLSPFHIAIQNCLKPNPFRIGNILIVDNLLKCNANMNSPTEKSETCFDFIKTEFSNYVHGNKALLTVLMKYAVLRDDVNAQSILLSYNIPLQPLVSKPSGNTSTLFTVIKEKQSSNDSAEASMLKNK